MLLLALAGNAIQLVPDGTLLLHLFIIVGMVAVLNATLLKPISRILADRELQTKGRLREAEQLLASTTEKLRIFDSTLREARSEGYLLLKNAREKVAREREQQVNKTKDEVAHWLREEKTKLGSEVELIRSTLEQDVPKIAGAIGRQILQRDIRQSR